MASRCAIRKGPLLIVRIPPCPSLDHNKLQEARAVRVVFLPNTEKGICNCLLKKGDYGLSSSEKFPWSWGMDA